MCGTDLRRDGVQEDWLLLPQSQNQTVHLGRGEILEVLVVFLCFPLKGGLMGMSCRGKARGRHVCVVTGRLFGLPIPTGPLVDLLLIARGFLIVDARVLMYCLLHVYHMTYLFLLG